MSDVNPIKAARRVDYDAHAGLFQGRGHHRGKGLEYRGFDSAALAIQFAMEDMHASHALGAILEVDEDRFDMNEIAALYHDARYPLVRKHRVLAPSQKPVQIGRFERMSTATLRARL